MSALDKVELSQLWQGTFPKEEEDKLILRAWLGHRRDRLGSILHHLTWPFLKHANRFSSHNEHEQKEQILSWGLGLVYLFNDFFFHEQEILRTELFPIHGNYVFPPTNLQLNSLIHPYLAPIFACAGSLTEKGSIDRAKLFKVIQLWQGKQFINQATYTLLQDALSNPTNYCTPPSPPLFFHPTSFLPILGIGSPGNLVDLVIAEQKRVGSSHWYPLESTVCVSSVLALLATGNQHHQHQHQQQQQQQQQQEKEEEKEEKVSPLSQLLDEFYEGVSKEDSPLFGKRFALFHFFSYYVLTCVIYSF